MFSTYAHKCNTHTYTYTHTHTHIHFSPFHFVKGSHQEDNSTKKKLHQTRTLLARCVLPEICGIILRYVQSTKRDWNSIAFAGEYESCMLLCWPTCADDAMSGACRGGHLELAELMISKGAHCFEWGLASACEGGQLKLAELMISKGAKCFNWGLCDACKGGHVELAKLMISKGAINFNGGLSSACISGHLTLAELMISSGANQCYSCHESIAEHLISISKI